MAKKLKIGEPLEAQLLQNTSLQFSRGKTAFGNEGGLKLLDKVQELDDKVQELDDRLQRNPFVLSIRIAALNDISGLSSTDSFDVYTRNRNAHGGALATDIFVIRMVPAKKTRLDAWKRTIKRFYGVDYELISEKIDTLPAKFVEILEQRFSVLTMKIWSRQKNRERGENLVKKCDCLIEAWISNSSSFENRLNEAHQEIMKDVYATIYDSARSTPKQKP